jgi:small conductance mechanosensitive channel
MENSISYLPQFYNMAIAYAPKLAVAIITLIVGFWLIKRVTNMASKGMEIRGIDASLRPFLSSIVNVGLKIMLLLSVAGMFGIETTSFIAIFTALVFAVGTALSGSLGHFASGVMLLIFRPYKVGDLVTAAGSTGTVEEIQVFNTVLLTPDNKRIIIPNGVVTAGTITNISGQGSIRVDMMMHTASAADVDQVRAVIMMVASKCPFILPNPTVDVYVNESQPGVTQYAVRPWCNSEHYWDTYFFMQENVKKAFAANNIPQPVPLINNLHS